MIEHHAPAGYSTHERPEVMALVPERARQVIDVGCAAGALGGALKRSRPGIEVRGVEITPRWAAQAALVLDQVACAAAEQGLPAGWPRPDCIILADVLEHLADPWATLRRWREVLQPDGLVVVSLPNVLHRSVLAGLLRARWDYQDQGILDRTHLRFFTRRTGVELLEQAALQVRGLQRCMDGAPLGMIGGQLLRRRRRQEERGEQLTCSDLQSWLLDLHTVQLLLTGA